MLKRIDIVGNPNVGVFIQATDDFVIVPYNLIDEKVKLVEEILEVPAVNSSISGSRRAISFESQSLRNDASAFEKPNRRIVSSKIRGFDA